MNVEQYIGKMIIRAMPTWWIGCKLQGSDNHVAIFVKHLAIIANCVQL